MEGSGVGECVGTDSRRPFLDRLDRRSSEQLRGLGTPQRFYRGDVLMRQGEPGEFVMLLTDGRVKITGQGREGSTVILDFGIRGDLYGEIAVVAGGTRLADVVAMGPAEARRIAAMEFHHFLEQYPNATKELLVSTARRFLVAQAQRKVPRKATPLSRVAERLSYLVDMCGVATQQGWLIDIPLSQSELAQFVPLGRTVVAEALENLRTLGVITSSRMTIVVTDRDKLDTLHRQQV
ncbi:Crp/Fnr family transcriptional regulator [Amycolatopsis cihanbeyliensis]|uniref:CRP-like cAMP-binding protein n=1 Tax=Amycolatopsis cihanbeyliensis TaxID=1128664 RepID=A0A542DQW7_AMYCI|nr:Crp/Fnr family transcriptional regulator [Amycolatopsis cihanbeyliensis]TQJ05499.1 CRP-like cAMP-binding protein [Amycolatopsis cihanbeyliensis]